MKILVADDEREIAELVELILKNEGYEVCKCFDGEQALNVIKETGTELDMAILDIMMPQHDGFEICAAIRERFTFPVIMLTAKSEDIDKITGLNIGADDYITKPFNPLELAARVKAQLRRYKSYNAEPSANIFEYDGLVINRDTHTCRLFEKDILLTPTEFNILWLLCENAGTVVSSEQIFEQVWGEDYLDSNNTVMVHIRRIREKLGEKPRAPRYIKTVWGVGYKVEKSGNN
ncbi:MAG: VanR-ABDEGLN family response regulator transcription factor [Oscillospiraceae bacterium]